MSYKYSKGATVQGDIKAEDDAQRDTLIDFGEDQIEFQTSGSTRLKVDNSGIVVTGSIEVTQSGDQEMLRFSKTDAETAEMVFEMGGNDKFSMFLNSFENMVFSTVNSSDDFLLKLAGVTAFYAQGSPKELKFWGAYNDNYNVIVNSSLRVSGSTQFDSAISFEDVIMAELSIPGLDLQTDTNAYRFTCPYNLELTALGLTLDQHTTSGNVTVNVTNPSDGTLITATIPGTDDFVQVTSVTSGSRSQGDNVTFEITATPANAQGLRANLYFKRTL
jgi:hypothetical protein